MNVNELAKEIHKIAVEHGWWEEERNFPEIAMLCVCEIAEAVEEYRNGRPMMYFCCRADMEPCEKGDCHLWDILLDQCTDGELYPKPEGIAVEMADCIIRILDWCGKEDIDIDGIIRRKMEYNKTRPYRHGGKKA